MPDEKPVEKTEPAKTEPAPKDATGAGATPGEASTAPPVSSGSGSPDDKVSKPDPELVIERALAAERKAAQELKNLEPLKSKLTKHEKLLAMLEDPNADEADIAEAMIKARGKELSDHFLFNFAKRIPEKAEPTEEEKRQAEIEAAIEKREAARKAAEAEAQSKKEAEIIEQGKKELEAHLTHVAGVLKTNLDSLVGLKAMGTSEQRYRELLVEAIDKGEDPKADGFALKLLQKMNDEAVGRLKAAGIIKEETAKPVEPAAAADAKTPEPGSLEEHAARVFNLHKPKNFKPEKSTYVDPFEESRAKLKAWDAEQRARTQ